MAENTVLIAGTIFEMQLVDGTWQRIPRITQPGATGEQAEAKEKTVLEDDIKKYGSGMRDAPDKNLQGQYIPPQSAGDDYELDRVLQQAFIVRCRAEEQFPMRVTFPDLERCTIEFKALGYQINDATQEDWKLFTINGKQNSRPKWSEAPMMTGVTITGNTSMSTSDTQTVTVGTTPTDAYYLPGMVFESSDPAIATVTQAGLVTAVSTGDVDITVTLNGFDEKLSITVS